MPKFDVDLAIHHFPEDIEVVGIDAFDEIDVGSSSLMDESVKNIGSIQSNKLNRPMGSKACKMKVSTVQSSFASSNRIAESNDNLAAALQRHNDLQERERALIAGSKILAERKNLKQERNRQPQESHRFTGLSFMLQLVS